MWRVLVICLLSLTVPVLASNPGEQLDCSDIVFLEPGFSCSVYIPDCSSSGFFQWCNVPGSMAFDNAGNTYHMEDVPPPAGVCNGFNLRHTELRRRSSTGVIETIASVDERCHLNKIDRFSAGGNPAFDPTTGTMFFRVVTFCDDPGGPGCMTYPQTEWMLAIHGFTTLFDVLSDCVPTSSKEKGPRCSDDIDNDCDGAVDGADPDCF